MEISVVQTASRVIFLYNQPRETKRCTESWHDVQEDGQDTRQTSGQDNERCDHYYDSVDSIKKSFGCLPAT